MDKDIERHKHAVRDIYKQADRAGIACGIKNTGIGNGMADTGRVLLRVGEGGSVEALTGFTEMGQGLHTIVRQVVCHETGRSLSEQLSEVFAGSRSVPDETYPFGL